MYIFDELIEGEFIIHKMNKTLSNMYNPYGELLRHFHYVDTDSIQMIKTPLKLNRKIKKYIKRYVKNYKRRLKKCKQIKII